jgi:hypothetical protein
MTVFSPRSPGVGNPESGDFLQKTKNPRWLLLERVGQQTRALANLLRACKLMIKSALNKILTENECRVGPDPSQEGLEKP